VCSDEMANLQRYSNFEKEHFCLRESIYLKDFKLA
jgi:hypothetical protein